MHYLTIENQIVSGRGAFGTNTLQIHNTVNGLILADNGTMTLDAGSLGLKNAGVMRATGASNVLQIQDTNVDNTDGFIQALSGGTVTLSGSTITGGLLEGDGRINMVYPLLTDITNYGTDVFVNNAHDLAISGTFINAGNVRVFHNNLGDPSSLEIQTDGATLNGGGTITLDGNLAQINGADGAVLRIENQTVEGRGQVGVDLVEIVIGQDGLIDATSSEIVFDSGGDGGENEVGAAVNKGLIRASNGGTLTIQNTDLDNSDGVIESEIGSTVNLTQNFSVPTRLVKITGGVLQGDGRFNLLYPVLVDVTNKAMDVRADNFRQFGIVGAFNNQGKITLARSSAGTPSAVVVRSEVATLTGGGTIDLGGGSWGANITGDADSVLILEDQTVTGGGAFNTIGDDLIEIVTTENTRIVSTREMNIDPIGSPAEAFINNGLLEASNAISNHVLTIQHDTINNGIIKVDSGCEFYPNSLLCNAGSLLKGNGTIRCDGGIQVNGDVEPGASAGSLNFRTNGPIDLNTTANIQIELFSDSSFDVLNTVFSNPTWNLGGQIKVFLRDGFIPDPTDFV